MRPPKKLTAAAVDQIRASSNYKQAASEAGIDEDRAKRIKKADTLEEALMIGGVDNAVRPSVSPEEPEVVEPNTESEPGTTTNTTTDETPDPEDKIPLPPEDKKKGKKTEKPKNQMALRAATASEANVLAIIPKSFTVNSLLLQVAKKVTEEEWHWPVMDMGDWIDTYLFWTMKQRGVVIGSYQMVSRNGNHSEEGRDAS